ncbi:MAG TPA: transmembrane Mn(2+) transporter, partial [Planctomycetes bacterium]|nr:transmembrane Mn(2+) transporter [Planctomycetota bacterium]
MIEDPPIAIRGVLRRLGPGLIVAGSIVGSGELIATTRTGAEAGFTLLWLILLGCIIKVFVQVEFGRFAIVTGATTMEGLNQVPGP